jgi:hypothetical protein
MMSSRRLMASNFLLVNPLLNGWEADPQLQSCISKLQQSFNIAFEFAVLPHRDAIVAATKLPVNSVAPGKSIPARLIDKRTKPYISGQ